MQHLLGVGHLKRAALIAKEAASLGMDVLLASGGKALAHLDLGHARIYQLPPAFSDPDFSKIYSEDGSEASQEWRDDRREELLSLFRSFDPHILLVEMYPFGRRAFRFELLPLLDKAKEKNIPIISSVRDILVKKSKSERNQEIVEIIRHYFDLILVHGDQALCDFNFLPLAEIQDKIRYTGYVVPPLKVSPRDGEDILVSAGGGAVGYDLLKQVLMARPKTDFAKAPWHVITGQNIGVREFTTLQELSGENVQLEKFRPDFIQLLAHCRFSISQGGYNTIMEILQCRKPALIVPFAEGEESEQEIRARLLAKKGWIEYLSPDHLSEDIIEAINRTGKLVPSRFALDMEGAAKSALYLKEMADGR